MDKELLALLNEARAAGANESQMDLIVDAYNQKKKNLSVTGGGNQTDVLEKPLSNLQVNANGQLQKSVPTTSKSELPASTETTTAFDIFPKTPTVTTNDGTQFPVTEIVTQDFVSTKNTPEAIQALQNRISSKTATQQDIESIAKSTGKSTDAVNGYINGGNIVGGSVENVENVNKTKTKLETYINNFNTVYGTQYDPNDILSSSQKTSDFLEVAKTKKAVPATQEDINKPISESTRMVAQQNAIPALLPLDISNEMISQVVSKTIEEDKVSGVPKDETIFKISKITNPQEFARISKAKVSTLTQGVNPITAIGELFRDNTGENELLNYQKGIAELAYNQSLKQNSINKISEGVLSGDANMITQGQHDLAQVDENVIDKYPALQKQEIVRRVNETIAQESGVVQGSEADTVTGYREKVFGATLADRTRVMKDLGYFDNPKTKDIAYNLLLNPNLFADNSILGSVQANVLQPFKDLGLSVADIAGLRNAKDIYSDKIKDELFPKDFSGNTGDEPQLKASIRIPRTILNTTANLVGMVAISTATEGVAGTLGASASLGQKLGAYTSFGLPSFDASLKDSKNFLDSEPAQYIYASINAIANAEGGRLLDLGKITRIPGVSENFAKIAKGLSDNSITESATRELLDGAKNKYIDFAVKYGKNVTKGAATMAYFTTANNIIKLGFGDPNTTELGTIEQAGHAFLDGVLGMSIIGGFGAVADMRNERNTTFKGTIYNIALNHDAAKDVFDIGLKNGEYDKSEYDNKIAILNTSVAAKNALDAAQVETGVELTQDQKAVYVANKTAENVFRGKAANEKLPEQKAKYEVQANRLSEQSTQTLDGLKFTTTLEPLYDLYNAEKEYNAALENYNPKDVASSDALETAKKNYDTLYSDYLRDNSQPSTKLSEPIKGLDEQGVPIERTTTEGGITVEQPQTFPEPITIGGEEIKPQTPPVTETTQPSTEVKTEEKVSVPSTVSNEVVKDTDLMKDEQGNPITFYHGTNKKNITELEPSTAQQFGKGIYFGNDKNADAIVDFGDGGKIFEVHLPSKLLDAGSNEYGKIEGKVEEDTGIDRDDSDFPIELVNDEIKKRGYKGVIANNDLYGGKEVMIFDKKDVTYKNSENKPTQNKEVKAVEQVTSEPVKPTTAETTDAALTEGKGETKGESINLPPIGEDTATGNVEGNDMIGITHAEIAKTRRELGLPEYGGKATETHEQLLETAQELIKGGFDLSKIFDKVKRNEPTSNVENAIMAEYKAALDVEMANNPTRSTLRKLSEFAKISDEAGTALGKGLESRKILKSLSEADTLANFLVQRGKDKGHTLTDAQIKEQVQKFNELKKAKETLEAALKIEQEKNAKLIAEQGLNKAKAIRKKEAKKTHEEYKAERKELSESIKQKWKNAGKDILSSDIPFRKQLSAIAPDVKRYVETLLSEGIDKLDNIVNTIHADLKDALDGISKNDIMNIIGGVHDEKRPTSNEKNAELRLLKREAQLLNTLQRERLGEENAKTETQKSEKSRRIQDLENKIKEIRQQRKERGVESEPIRENVATGEENKAEQKRLTKRIEKLQDDLKNKRFAPEPKKQNTLILTRQTQLLQDKVIQLENKIAEERYKDERSKMSGWEKAWDKFQNIAGIRRVVQTAIDASIWFRQLGSLALNPRKWDIAKKFIIAGSRSVFSQTNYDRYMNGIHKAEDFKESLDDGIRYNELNEADPKNRNEFFPRSFVYKIPVIRELLTASQRIADSSMNVARYELYNKYKERFLKEGITRESDPEIYKEMAKLVMNTTGSGNLLSMLENRKAEKVMGSLFYGSRLMAANFNTLNPVYYLKMPKEVRREAMKDLAGYTSTLLATTLALAAAGGKVSLDPDESGFLQIRFGKKIYDLTGGKAAYVRTFLRLVEAGYSRATRTKYEAGKDVEFAGESTLRFFRNKLSPNTSYAINALWGKNTIGQPFDPYEVIKIYPMYADDAYKAAKEDGYTSLLTVLLPNIIGVGYGNYFSEPAMKPIEETLQRNMRSDEINKESIKNYNKDGAAITDKEFQTYIEKRDAAIEKGIRDLYEGTAPENLVLDENNEVVTKKYNKLSKEQIIAATSSIKKRATEQVKEELFGEKVMTKEEKKAQKKLGKAHTESKKVQ